MICSEICGTVATVFVVDPDPATGKITQELFDGSEVHCESFRCGRDFLEADCAARPGCLVLERRLPDMSGLQLQNRLSASGSTLPLIFVMSSPDVSLAVELMRGGAVHVLEKPARSIELFSAIQEAIALDQERRIAKAQRTKVRDLIASLSEKQVQVLELIARGKSIKAMAKELELSVRAVELRRNGLMSKLELQTPLELMRFAVIAAPEFGSPRTADPSPALDCA